MDPHRQPHDANLPDEDQVADSPETRERLQQYTSLNPFLGGAAPTPSRAASTPKPPTAARTEPRRHQPVDIPRETRARGLPDEFLDDIEPVRPANSMRARPPRTNRHAMPPMEDDDFTDFPTAPGTLPMAPHSHSPGAAAPHQPAAFSSDARIVRTNDHAAPGGPPPLPFEAGAPLRVSRVEEPVEEEEEYEEIWVDEDGNPCDPPSEGDDEYEYVWVDEDGNPCDPPDDEDEVDGPDASPADFIEPAPERTPDEFLANDSAGPRQMTLPRKGGAPQKRLQALSAPDEVRSVLDTSSTAGDRGVDWRSGLSTQEWPGAGLWENSPAMVTTLARLPLTRDEMEALRGAIENDSRVFQAVARLCGIARSQMEIAERTEDTGDRLHRAVGALRQTVQERLSGRDVEGQSAHADAHMLQQLMAAVAEMRVLREGFDLVPQTANMPAGNPHLLGLVETIGMWTFEPAVGKSNGPGKDPYARPGTSQDLLGRLLGRYNRTQSQTLKPKPGEYVLGSVEVLVGGRAEPIWFLSQVSQGGKLSVPAKREDGEYRRVQGLVDGVLVRDPKNGHEMVITDESGFGPLVLSRRMVRVTKQNQATDANVADVELALDREGTFFLEPAYLAQRCGLFDPQAATRVVDQLAPQMAMHGHQANLSLSPDDDGPIIPTVPRGPLAQNPAAAASLVDPSDRLVNRDVALQLHNQRR